VLLCRVTAGRRRHPRAEACSASPSCRCRSTTTRSI